MNKIGIIYWSQTGNTEAMANAVLEGVREAGGEAVLFTVSDIDAAAAAQYNPLALGCPAMGAEVLEEAEFEPFFTALEPRSKGKMPLCSAPTAGVTANGCGTGRIG